jgi:hypothetical protein
LDKNAGNHKTVRASGVTIQDSSNADVSANYNIRYEDNFASSIESILIESMVPSPLKQASSVASTAFKYSTWQFNQPMGNAMAGSPALVVPEVLQKSLDLPRMDGLPPVDGNAENKEER